MNSENRDAPLIIGVDNGFGNTKTRNCCFPTGVLSYDKEIRCIRGRQRL